MISIDNKLDFIFLNFQNLERDLIQFMEYVPYIPDNYNILSPKLNTIILEACSLAESVLKHFAVGDKKKNLNLKHYSKVTEPLLELGRTTSMLLNFPVSLIKPFAGWDKRQPNWWKVYNQLKHDRISNYNVATYENAVLSIAGLHQVLSRSRLFIGNMIAAGWINNDSEDFLDLLASRNVGTGPPEIAVESKIFATPLRGNFVHYEKGNPIIDNWDFTNRTKNLIYESEESGAI